MVEIPLHIRERIVAQAIDWIDQYGARPISTKEIARQLGVSESTVFKQFPTKSDLLAAVLEQASLYDRDLLQTALLTQPATQALQFYLEAQLTYFENYPAITALLPAHELFRDSPVLAEQARTIQLQRRDSFRRLVEGLQPEGGLRAGVTAEQLADMLWAVFNGQCLRWRMGGRTWSLRASVMDLVRLLVAAFVPQTEDGSESVAESVDRR